MLAFGALLFLGLALGDRGALAPWSLMRSLPILEHLRVPSRNTLPALFFMSAIAGMCYDRLSQTLLARVPARALALAAWSLTLAPPALLALDSVRLNRGQFEQSFHLPAPTDSVSPKFQQRRGDPSRMFAYPRANEGSVIGFEDRRCPCPARCESMRRTRRSSRRRGRSTRRCGRRTSCTTTSSHRGRTCSW